MNVINSVAHASIWVVVIALSFYRVYTDRLKYDINKDGVLSLLERLIIGLELWVQFSICAVAGFEIFEDFTRMDPRWVPDFLTGIAIAQILTWQSVRGFVFSRIQRNSSPPSEEEAALTAPRDIAEMSPLEMAEELAKRVVDALDTKVGPDASSDEIAKVLKGDEIAAGLEPEPEQEPDKP